MKAKKALLALGLALAVLAGCWQLLSLVGRPKLTEEERRELALNVAKGFKLPTGEALEEAAQMFEKEGFSIAWHVEHHRGDWYKVWFTGAAPDGRRCGSALFYVNISTGEVRMERVIQV